MPKQLNTTQHPASEQTVLISRVCSVEKCRLTATAAHKMGTFWLSLCDPHQAKSGNIDFSKVTPTGKEPKKSGSS